MDGGHLMSQIHCSKCWEPLQCRCIASGPTEEMRWAAADGVNKSQITHTHTHRISPRMIKKTFRTFWNIHLTDVLDLNSHSERRVVYLKVSQVITTFDPSAHSDSTTAGTHTSIFNHIHTAPRPDLQSAEWSAEPWGECVCYAAGGLLILSIWVIIHTNYRPCFHTVCVCVCDIHCLSWLVCPRSTDFIVWI